MLTMSPKNAIMILTEPNSANWDIKKGPVMSIAGDPIKKVVQIEGNMIMNTPRVNGRR